MELLALKTLAKAGKMITKAILTQLLHFSEQPCEPWWIPGASSLCWLE